MIVPQKLAKILREVSCYLVLAFLSLAIVTSGSQAGNPKPVGSIVISAKQISLFVSGQSGGGTLSFKGRHYPFRLGGIGVGGIGISRLEARGEVYQLSRAQDFYGSYGAARIGWAVGNASSGQIWLKNSRGVVLHLWAKRKGLMLSLGGDVVEISPP
jgi:hypothetical protein